MVVAVNVAQGFGEGDVDAPENQAVRERGGVGGQDGFHFRERLLIEDGNGSYNPNQEFKGTNRPLAVTREVPALMPRRGRPACASVPARPPKPAAAAMPPLVVLLWAVRRPKRGLFKSQLVMIQLEPPRATLGAAGWVQLHVV